MKNKKTPETKVEKRKSLLNKLYEDLNLKSIRDFPDWMRWKLTDAQRFLFLCILSGLACGLVAVGFHMTIHWIYETWMHSSQEMGGALQGWVLILTPSIAGLVVGLLLQYGCSSAVGSGIPQAKQAYYLNFGIMHLKDAIFRFVAGSLSVGLGNSLGREGPTAHISSAVASKIGQWFGLAKSSVRSMVPVGMGAGIAAAFNTPFAAIFFVFEELLEDFSSKALGGILIAVVIAAVVARSILGEHATFELDLPTYSTHYWMLIVLAMGLSAGLHGHFFVTLLLWLRSKTKGWKKIPQWVKPGIGGLSVGLIGYTVFQITNGSTGVFSMGYDDLSSALSGNLVWTVLLLLFIGKFFATAFAYSLGGSGGIFAPVLFLGGMLGGLYGELLYGLFDLPEGVDAACAVLGMGAFFAAVIRCPLTSILMIFEMTRNYSLILPLMLGNMLAYVVAGRLRSVSIYDALLIQDKISLKRMPSYRGQRDWRNLPVSTIMTHDLVTLQADWTTEDAMNNVIKPHRHHAYPVLNEHGELDGIVTCHEIESAIQEGSDARVGELSHAKALITVNPDTSIRDVANRLVLGEVEQAPVVSKRDSKRLLGIITLHDIARQQNAILDKREED